MLSYDHKCGHLRSAVIVSFSFPRPLFVGNVIRCCSNVSLVCSCWPQLIPTQHVALAGRPSHDLISLILSGCWGTVLRYCCSTVRGIHRFACCCLWLLFKKRYRHFILNCASVRVWRLNSAQNLKRNTFMLHCYICLIKCVAGYQHATVYYIAAIRCAAFKHLTLERLETRPVIIRNKPCCILNFLPSKPERRFAFST